MGKIKVMKKSNFPGNWKITNRGQKMPENTIYKIK